MPMPHSTPARRASAVKPIHAITPPEPAAAITACRSRNSGAKPGPNGKAAIPAAPTSISTPNRGIAAHQPAQPVQRGGAGGLLHRPRAQKQQRLEQPHAPRRRATPPAAPDWPEPDHPIARARSAMPSPTAISPTCSTVEQASTVFSSTSSTARNAPINTEAAPATINAVPHQGCDGVAKNDETVTNNHI